MEDSSTAGVTIVHHPTTKNPTNVGLDVLEMVYLFQNNISSYFLDSPA